MDKRCDSSLIIYRTAPDRRHFLTLDTHIGRNFWEDLMEKIEHLRRIKVGGVSRRLRAALGVGGLERPTALDGGRLGVAALREDACPLPLHCITMATEC